MLACHAVKAQLTVSFGARGSGAVANLALVLQVEVPALFLPILVLDVEGNDGFGSVNSLFATSLVALEGLVDGVERGGGGVGIYSARLAWI